MDLIAKTILQCDNCKQTISLPDKGKNKESQERKKSEPVPLTAILDYGMDGVESKEFSMCSEE